MSVRCAHSEGKMKAESVIEWKLSICKLLFW